MLFLSASRSDELSRARLHRVVGYALAKSIAKIPYDQESVAIWDDAVKNVGMKFDPKWVDINLGVWMHDYFKHDRTYVLGADGRVLYAMADGQQVSVASRPPVGKLTELISALRRRMKDGALDLYEQGAEKLPRAVDLGYFENRPAIVSVVPLVSDTAELVQPRGSENLLASVRFLDSSFLPDLAEAHLLKSVRYSKSGDVSPDEQAYAFRDSAGASVGYFIWRPDLSGRTILSDLTPLYAIGSFAIGVAVAFLVRSLWRTWTRLIASEAHAQHLAFQDAMSGLPNRAYFNRQLDSAVAGLENGDGFSLVFLDLDRFKEVNDTYGHSAGDALIRQVGRRLAPLLASGATLARIGGDEFAIVFPSNAASDVERLADTIVAAISEPFDLDEARVTIGISLGIVMAPENGNAGEDLARKADLALHHAKKSPDRRIQLFTDDMIDTIQSRRKMEGELRKAIETGSGLEVVYQPVYTVEGLKLTGAEALVRWQHPELGAISPSVFIALAEECGLINKLGDWVLRKACGAAQAWELDTIAVNVSTLQCQRPDFAERVLALLRDTGMPPGRLEIEVTESVLLDSTGASARTLKTLRESGVRIALDDFGTGYSSLSYLINLEIDRIKIDQSFVRQLDTSRSRSIVKAIVAMAKAVDVAITAEGVETHAQLTYLAQIECDQLQGYLLSKPVPASKLTTMLSGATSTSITAA